MGNVQEICFRGRADFRNSMKRRGDIIKRILNDREILERLYHVHQLSLNDIALLLGINEAKLSRAFKRLGIPTRPMSDAVSLAKSRGKYKPYDNDELFSAEMLALTHTDFHVYHEKRKIKISTTTTHITQIKFFSDIIDRHGYGPVKCTPHKYGRKIPRFEKVSDFCWRTYVYLDESFDFLLSKDIKFEDYDEERLLIHFTRALECDGGINIHVIHGRIYGDLFITSKVNYNYLRKLGEAFAKTFKVQPRLTIKQDGMAYLYFTVTDRIIDVLEKMPIIHPEEAWRKEFLLENHHTAATPEKLEALHRFKMEVKALVKITTELAKERHGLPKGKKVINAKDLINLVVKRYQQSSNAPPLFPFFSNPNL